MGVQTQMRFSPLALLFGVVTLFSGSAQASGFGWYVCSVDWKQHIELVAKLDRKYSKLLASADTPELRSKYQLDADSEIVDECADEDDSPHAMEFYDVEFVTAMAAEQSSRGVKGSFFSRFQALPEVVEIDKGRERALIDPVYFALSPAEVTAFHAELVDINKRPRSGPERSLLRHLEAVLAKALADNYGEDDDESSEAGTKQSFENGERGILFHGHD